MWIAKAYSAHLLHKLTLRDNLRVFLCFSSVAAVFGNMGQAAYAAANGFLDGLIKHRLTLGLPGVYTFMLQYQ